MGKINIPEWKVILTDKVKDYTGGSSDLVQIYTTDADRMAVYQAVRYLPGYAKARDIRTFNGGVRIWFEGSDFGDKSKHAREFINDLELVQEEVEALREAEEEAAGESGQFVNPQTPNPTVTVNPVETPTTTSTTAIVQETVNKLDAKTILFGGLIIAAVILIFKK